MTMDDATVQGVLAYMTYKLETERKRQLAEELALRQYRSTGAVEVARLRSDFDSAWEPTTPAQLQHEIAKMAQAAVEGHGVLAEDEGLAVGVAEAKIESVKADLEAAQNALYVAQQGAAASSEIASQSVAQTIADAAIAAGGDPAKAIVPEPQRQRPAVVEEAVTELIGAVL